LKRGLYIAVEGIDGAGKTTQSKRLIRYFRQKRIPAIYVEEPTKNPVGTLVRKGLRGEISFSEEEMALLFAADRLWLKNRVVLPALRKGYNVVSDRSVISSLAYQTAATSQRKWVAEINKHALKPDIIVYIELNPLKAIKRIAKTKQRYEKINFLRLVDKEYKRVIGREKNVVWVNGDAEIEQVFDQMIKGLTKLVPQLRR